MDASRESYHEKNKHVPSTNKNETSSSLSSDSDQTTKSSQKKRKEKKTSKPILTPDYFPMYTPPWATMNYVYLDLLRQLSLESQIRSSLTKIDKRYDYSYLNDFQTKKKLEEEKCCDRRKMKHKLCTCEVFNMSCSHLCLSCHQRVKCSACGQAILQSRAPETAVKEIKPCKCVNDSCPTLLDQQHIPLSYCHYQCEKPTYPCHSLSHNVCGNLNHLSVDTPVREVPELYKSIRRDQHPLNSEACNESGSNLDRLLNENCFGVDTGDAINFGSKNQPVLQIVNKDGKTHEFEDDFRIVPSFLGGTGDEGPKLQVKRTRKSRLPRSTAYFLPISSLSKN